MFTWECECWDKMQAKLPGIGTVALIFRGSLILQISWIWNHLQNYFMERFDTSKLIHIEQHIRNYYLNKIKKKPSYLRKFRPAKYKRYTVFALIFFNVGLLQFTYSCLFTYILFWSFSHLACSLVFTFVHFIFVFVQQKAFSMSACGHYTRNPTILAHSKRWSTN